MKNRNMTTLKGIETTRTPYDHYKPFTEQYFRYKILDLLVDLDKSLMVAELAVNHPEAFEEYKNGGNLVNIFMKATKKSDLAFYSPIARIIEENCEWYKSRTLREAR